MASKIAPSGWVWVGASVLCQVGSTTAFKLATIYGGEKGLLGLLLNPFYVCALGLLGSQVLVWRRALLSIPISIAYPTTSIVLPINTLVAFAFFGERLRGLDLLSVLLVTTGVVLVASANR